MTKNDAECKAREIVEAHFKSEYSDKHSGYYDACNLCEMRWPTHELDCTVLAVESDIAAALERHQKALDVVLSIPDDDDVAMVALRDDVRAALSQQ